MPSTTQNHQSAHDTDNTVDDTVSTHSNLLMAHILATWRPVDPVEARILRDEALQQASALCRILHELAEQRCDEMALGGGADTVDATDYACLMEWLCVLIETAERAPDPQSPAHPNAVAVTRNNGLLHPTKCRAQKKT
jgi:hypothetical protein